MARYFFRQQIDLWGPHGSVQAMNCAQQKQKTLTTSGICALPSLFLIGVTTIHSQFNAKMMMRHAVMEQEKMEMEHH